MLAFRRRCAQTAHISLRSFNFQRARGQNIPRRQFPSVPRTALSSVFALVASATAAPVPLPSPSGVVFVSVRRYLRRHAQTRKREKAPAVAFSLLFPIYLQNLMVGEMLTNWSAPFRQLSFARKAGPTPKPPDSAPASRPAPPKAPPGSPHRPESRSSRPFAP